MLSPSWCMRYPATKDSSPRPKLPSKTNKKMKKSNDKSKSPKLTTEPSSPRVSCLGQIKSQLRSSSSTTSSPSSFRGNFDLLLIKRFVSSKILIKEMDPPRPVQRKEARDESSGRLWKRRCVGGDSLKLNLQSMEQVSA